MPAFKGEHYIAIPLRVSQEDEKFVALLLRRACTPVEAHTTYNPRVR